MTFLQSIVRNFGAILPLRKRYDTFANFRPVRLPRQLAEFSPLKAQYIGEGLDILMIRELVGGIYFGEKIEGSVTGMRYATDECPIRKSKSDIAVVAFEEARERHARLTNIDKANVLATSRFWKKIVEDVAQELPEVSYQSMLVDNAAYQLIKNPTVFNGVALLENMQGDILTDQAGGIIGSLGLMPSACIGPQKSYVEAAHGSAPDIVGKNIANPYSMMGSVALLLRGVWGFTVRRRRSGMPSSRSLNEGIRPVTSWIAADRKGRSSRLRPLAIWWSSTSRARHKSPALTDGA